MSKVLESAPKATARGIEQGMLIRFEIADITPEQARRWLDDREENNRHISRGVVARYARAMAEGRWHVTHQAVAFNAKGRLIDGQHRLWAVIESGMTVRMTVAYNVPVEAMPGVDVGRKRTIGDIMSIMDGGQPVHWQEVAAAKAMLTLPMGTDVKSLSDLEIMECVRKHREAINWAMRSFTPKIARVCAADTYALLAKAYYDKEGRERLLMFIRVLAKAYPDNAVTDKAAVLLRHFLENHPNSRNYTDRVHRYRRGQHALEEFMLHQSVEYLEEMDTEMFPNWNA